eukprot:TRINITY_DN49212_c0_g1_i1.p1 TRINITY_DN49212_c0_g1~~TRINITY_DN49212_c0_g1_i1.p1  ORF type:complete len:219 (-),score=35.35 TRINITY_DN49212_c0_g1_i1:172-771(-)
MASEAPKIDLEIFLPSGSQLAKLCVSSSSKGGDVVDALVQFLPPAAPGFQTCVSKLLLGADVFEKEQTVEQVGLVSGSVLLAVLEEFPEFQHFGNFKCWWSDVQEVFEIKSEASGTVSVLIHDFDIGMRPAIATNVEFSDSFLKFRTAHRNNGCYTQYKIQWDHEVRPAMYLSDCDGAGEVYNTEWGWVVPYEEDYLPH